MKERPVPPEIALWGARAGLETLPLPTINARFGCARLAQT